MIRLLVLHTIICLGTLQAQELDMATVVRDAFEQTHDGWSSDEVVLQDELNQRFIAAAQTRLKNAKPEDLNWKLLNLRKAGKLKSRVTKRRHDDHAAYRHLAEIVARTMQDKYRTSIDHIICHVEQRLAFNELAKKCAPKVEPYLMRKAAFGLRKARQLRPELVLRIADWDREINAYPAVAIAADLDLVPESPGIYIFRDKSGYLYIGESINLRKRLKSHLDDSDRQSLAQYLRSHGIEKTTIELHAFPKDSRARLVSVRRAYESELIASRKPRFNVRP